MPRVTGGNSPLGSTINRVSSKQDETYIAQPKIKYGIIKEIVGRKMKQGVYTVVLQIINKDGSPGIVTGPIPLEGHPNFLAANYGPPEELVNRYVCRVDFKGNSVSRGVATIVRDLTDDKEITEKTNQVEVTGAAFSWLV